MEMFTCPLCGSCVNHARHETPLPIRTCACGLTFLWPRPSAGELGEIYSEEYYLSWGVAGENEDSPRSMKHRTFAARLDTVKRHMAVGKVLDVGCATGFFLEAAQEHGWDVYGVELSRYAARLAQKKFGGRVFNGTLEEAGFADNEFDLVALSDLLEHIPDPLHFLGEVWRILKPGGMAMIVTPNVASLSERLMRGKWSHYKTEHLYYFSPRTIGKCLVTLGFEPLFVKSAPKYLNIDYMVNQFTNYRHPLLTPILSLIGWLLPRGLKKNNFPVLCGEMMALARKGSD